jgi:hypothetical protein
MEWHLPLAILLHFHELVFNNNGLVDHVLEVCESVLSSWNMSCFFSLGLMSSGASR